MGLELKPLAALLLAIMAGCTTTGTTASVTQSSMEDPANLFTSNAAGGTYTVYLTGYTWWDNTPPGSAAIARPVLRQRAGGTGSYASPITIAVGHSITGGQQTLDYPAGTRFYLPRLRKYAIVEDVCGDGAQPQLGPCHTGHQGRPWLDIWLGGRSMEPAAADACARRITGLQPIVQDPPRDLPVVEGEIASDGCRTFG